MKVLRKIANKTKIGRCIWSARINLHENGKKTTRIIWPFQKMSTKRQPRKIIEAIQTKRRKRYTENDIDKLNAQNRTIHNKWNESMYQGMEQIEINDKGNHPIKDSSDNDNKKSTEYHIGFN